MAELAQDLNTSIIGTLDRSELVLEAEELGKTVLEAFPGSDMAGQYRKLAEQLMEVLKGSLQTERTQE